MKIDEVCVTAHGAINKREKPLRMAPKRLRLNFGCLRGCYFLVSPIAGRAQALEIFEEVRLNRCAISLQWKSEELIDRNAAVSGVFNYRADRIAQRISLESGLNSDVALAQQVV